MLYWPARPARLRCGLLLVAGGLFHTHFAGVLTIVALTVVTFLAGLSGAHRALVPAMALSVLALVL